MAAAFDYGEATVNRSSFGLLIAYVIPGFTVVAVAAARLDFIQPWLGLGSTTAPTVGGFLYVSVASIAMGVTLSAIRWLVLDRLHGLMGIRPPKRNYAVIHASRSTFEYWVEMHYRYYEFFGHMFLAVVFAIINLWQIAAVVTVTPWILLGWLSAAALLFFVASRDTLAKYYQRTAELLKPESRCSQNANLRV